MLAMEASCLQLSVITDYWDDVFPNNYIQNFTNAED